MARIPPASRPLRDGRLLTIRNPRLDEAPDLLAMLEENVADGAGQILLPGELVMSIEQEEEWIGDHLDRPEGFLAVAEVEGEVVGILNALPEPRARLSHCLSFGLAVRPAWRAHGAGRALVEALIDWAEAAPSIEKICLMVLSDNPPALALYRKLGFTEEGCQPRQVKYGKGRYADNVLMYRRVGAAG